MSGIQGSLFQGLGQTCMYFDSLIMPLLRRTELTFKGRVRQQFECCGDTGTAMTSFPFRLSYSALLNDGIIMTAAVQIAGTD